MKKTVFILFVSTLLFSSQISFAEPLPRRVFEIGPEIYRFVYKEHSVRVEDKGTMFGLRGSFTWHTENNMMWRIEGAGAWGDVDYSSGSTGSTDNIHDSMYELRGLVGYDFINEETKLYTVYSGIGYRRLNDDGGGTVTTTGHRGYDRESNYYYLPLGVEGTERFVFQWEGSIGISLVAALDLNANLRTAFSRIGMNADQVIAFVIQRGLVG